MILEFLFAHFNYWICVVLFMIGFYALIGKGNLIKKIMGYNIVETSVFLLFMSAGDVEGGVPPLFAGPHLMYANPLPACLMVTGLVIAVCVTGVSLSIAVRMCEEFRTLDSERLRLL